MTHLNWKKALYGTLTTLGLFAGAEAAMAQRVSTSCAGSGSTAYSYLTNNDNQTIQITGNLEVTVYYDDGSSFEQSNYFRHYLNETLRAREWLSFTNNVSGQIRYCYVNTAELTIRYLEPSTPRNLRLTDRDFNELSVAWDPGSDGELSTTYYRVDISESSNMMLRCDSPLSQTVGLYEDATFTNLKKGARYYVAVCAFANNGTYRRSSILTTSTLADPAPNVSNLVALSQGPDNVVVTWANGGGSTYDYVYSIVQGTTPPASCAGGTVTSSLGFTKTGLLHNTNYALRVCARNINNTPAAGVTATVRTQDPNNATLPFQDQFNRANAETLGAGWATRGGSFGIRKQLATATGKSTSVATLNNLAVQNVAMSILIDRTGGIQGDGVGLVARHSVTSGQTKMYVARIWKKGKTTNVSIIRYNGSAVTTLATTALTKQDGTFRFDVIGSSLKAYMNNVNVLSATDTQIMTAGGVGVAAFGKAEQFDNFYAKAQ